MAFNPRKFNELFRQGFEAVAYAKKKKKLATDKFIADEMLELCKKMGDEVWELETIRRRRGKGIRRTPVSSAVLNKIVYIFLSEAGELLKAEWADHIFAANDMGREDMQPEVIQLRDKFQSPFDLSDQTSKITKTVSVPLQRPPRPAYFVNREQELKELMAALQPSRVVTLCGSGGIGKSALASVAVRQLTSGDFPPEQFPDGVITYNFYNQPEVALALEHIARSYDIEPLPTAKSAAARALAGRQALLVLDGVEVADNLSEILSVMGQCGVLLTTRRRRNGTPNCFMLEVLPVDEAVALLKSWTGQTIDENIAQKICQLVDGLPLAVRLAGQYIGAAQEDPASYLNWLEQASMAALHHGEHQHESVPILLRKSLAQVNERARQTLAVVGVLAPLPFTAETVTTALELPIVEVKAALGQLVIYGILQREDNRYRVSHLLIYSYAQQYYPPPTIIIKQLALFFTNLAQVQTREGVKGFARLGPERKHIMAILAVCVQRKAWQSVHQLASAIDEYLDSQGYWTEHVTALEAGLSAAHELKAYEIEANFLTLLGTACIKTGQFEKAVDFWTRGLELTEQMGDRQRYVRHLHDLGSLYYELDSPDLALRHYQLVLTLARELGDERLMGTCQGNIGLVYQKLGEPEVAIEYLQQGRVSARKFNSRLEESYYLRGLGLVYMDLGRPEQAIEYHQQALQISQASGDRHSECLDLGNLGLAHFYLHQLEAARQYLQQAVDLARQMNDFVSQARWLVQLAEVYYRLGQPGPVRACLAEALPLFELFNQTEAEQVRNVLASLPPADADT